MILEEGISGITLGQIASRLKCSRRRLYEIADTKEELFLKIAESTLRDMRETGWADAARANDASAKVLAYFNHGSKVAGLMSSKFLSDLESNEQGRKLFDEHQRMRIQTLENFLVEEMAASTFVKHNVRFVSESALLLIRALRDENFRVASKVSFEQGLRELWELLLFGLVVRPSERIGDSSSGA